MTDTQAPRRIAIACQGGGSHTAFTAGALQSLVRHEQNGAFRISALSGTSGGALCALLAWVGLIKQRTQGWDVAQTTALIEALWMDNAAQSPAEKRFNKAVITTYNLQGRGLLPSFAVNPYGMKATSAMDMLKNMFPRPEFLDLQALLAKHVDLATITNDAQALLEGGVSGPSGRGGGSQVGKYRLLAQLAVGSVALAPVFLLEPLNE